MKKLATLTFAMAIVLVSYAENGEEKSPKATNYKQILTEIEYPKVCREKGIEGKVVVMLKIDKFGEVQSHEFKSAPCSEMKEAVKDVIPNMTFKPAVDQNGKNVAGKIALPINFKLSL